MDVLSEELTITPQRRMLFLNKLIEVARSSAKVNCRVTYRQQSVVTVGCRARTALSYLLRLLITVYPTRFIAKISILI